MGACREDRSRDAFAELNAGIGLGQPSRRERGCASPIKGVDLTAEQGNEGRVGGTDRRRFRGGARGRGDVGKIRSVLPGDQVDCIMHGHLDDRHAS